MTTARTLIAGTTKGVFLDGVCQLACGGVRELVRVGDAILAGSGAGLYRSTDGGLHWDLVGLENYEIWQVRVDSLDRIWVGTLPAGLFFSDDQGLTWHGVDAFNDSPHQGQWCIPLDPPVEARARAIVIDRDNPQRILVGVEVGGIMRSEDRGASWSLVLPGNNPDLHMIFQHTQNPDVVFASTGYGRLDGIAEMIEGNAGVFRSEDFGQTWDYRWVGIEPRYSRPMVIDDIGITVASAPSAFASYKQAGGAQAMLFHSADEGVSWRELCAEASHANFHGLVADPEQQGAVYVGTDTGEIWHVDQRAQWQQVSANLPAVLSIVL
jgi:hypothetical protein